MIQPWCAHLFCSLLSFLLYTYTCKHHAYIKYTAHTYTSFMHMQQHWTHAVRPTCWYMFFLNSILILSVSDCGGLQPIQVWIVPWSYIWIQGAFPPSASSSAWTLTFKLCIDIWLQLCVYVSMCLWLYALSVTQYYILQRSITHDCMGSEGRIRHACFCIVYCVLCIVYCVLCIVYCVAKEGGGVKEPNMSSRLRVYVHSRF